MIDHVYVAVRDLAASTRFYEAVLATLGHTLLVTRPHTVGFGKKYAELWLNHRPTMAPVAADGGVHICLRAASTAAVDAFHAAALAAGGRCDGPPGFRAGDSEGYYAAFVRDGDGNRIEAVTFVSDKS
jgi:catechol 2,3-dioxygenase-like lactoylglutathione lyase family enzyme